jgi:magnesium-transporting ATPase (P-type)
MKLNNDWSLGHFLYYICWFTLAGIILQFVSISIPLLSNSSSLITLKDIDAPIEISTKSLNLDQNSYKPDGSYLTLFSSVLAYPAIFAEQQTIRPNLYLIHSARFMKFATMCIFLFMLTRILKSVINSNPFASKNSSRLFVMGISMIFLSLFSILQNYLLVSAFNNSSFASDFDFGMSPLGLDGSVVFGLSLILLSYVFKEGTRLYEEQKLTV